MGEGQVHVCIVLAVRSLYIELIREQHLLNVIIWCHRLLAEVVHRAHNSAGSHALAKLLLQVNMRVVPLW